MIAKVCFQVELRANLCFQSGQSESTREDQIFRRLNWQRHEAVRSIPATVVGTIQDERCAWLL